MVADQRSLHYFSFIYHQQQGNSDISTPLVDGKEVDLWLLRKEVSAVGGFNEVSPPRLLLPSHPIPAHDLPLDVS